MSISCLDSPDKRQRRNTGSRLLAHIAVRVAAGCMGLLLAQFAFAQADTLAGAKYDVVDRYEVNMASGQVQIKQTTLSIGGSMGLEHQISSLTSDFMNVALYGGGVPTVYGFGDSHRGGFYTVVLLRQHTFPQYWTYGIRVFGGGVSADFIMTPSGDFTPFNVPSSHTLEFQNDADFTGYVLTTGDGTRMYYPGNRVLSVGVNIHIRRPISKIVYPNGLTIDIVLGPSIDGSMHSVRTNTGFQLKYDFTGKWTGSSPTKVTALNNRYERCPFDQTPCSPSSYWPFATYTWPVGEPDDWDAESLNQDSVFAVRDSEGRVTEYHHSPYEPEVGQHAPRLVRIKKDGKTVRTYDYEFNQFTQPSSSNHSIIQTTGIATVGSASAPGGASHNYTMHIPKIMYGSYVGNINGGGGGPGSINMVESTYYGALVQAYGWDQHISFYHMLTFDSQLGVKQAKNWITSVRQNQGAIITTYQYDSRGNVTEKTASGASSRAHYATSCTSANYKYCNKPIWIQDRRGNRTYYTYHPQSGNIASKTLPANSAGIKLKTVYQYAQYYAHYKVDSESIEAADTPIWLLASQISCQNSVMHANGTCAGDDKITVSYQYDYYNLYPRGKAVTAKNTSGVMETHRTCYEYDKLGNKIGETSPRANLSTCL